MSSSANVKLRYEKCLGIWGNAKPAFTRDCWYAIWLGHTASIEVLVVQQIDVELAVAACIKLHIFLFQLFIKLQCMYI
jgi:hypothetical protein